jgi:hypothetical protein
VLGTCACVIWIAPGETRSADNPPTPKVVLGKDTTYVTGPLDKQGYIDYEAALNELLSKGIKPETNANVLLWKALGPRPEGGQPMPPAYFKWLGIEAPPEDGSYFVGLGAYVNDKLKLEAGERDVVLDQSLRAAQRPWTPKDFPHIAGWLETNEKTLALVVEATRRPDYFNPLVVHRKNEKEVVSLIGALLPSVQKCRELANSLVARALLRVAEGKIDAAWQDLLACHRLGRLVARGGTLIESLVGIAINQIAANADLAFLERANLTAQEVQCFLRDLQRLPLSPMADKIDVTERIEFLDSIQVVRRGGFKYLEDLAGRGQPREVEAKEQLALDTLDWAPAMRNGNRWYDRMVTAMRVKDRADREKQLNQVDRDLRKLKGDVGQPVKIAGLLMGKTPPEKVVVDWVGNVMISLLMPATRKVMSAADRFEQVQRNLEVAFALAAYRREHGRYPEKLDALAPKHLATIPGDLFSGKALIYRSAANAYLLYSVGINGKDDGGRSYDDDPPGDDLSVRMPLPALKQK